MRNRTSRGIPLVIGLLWLGAACGGDDEEESAAEQTANACASICARRELCDSTTDESDCVEACSADTAIAPSVFQIQADCANDVSCDELDGATFLDCRDDAISELSPSNDGETFCEDYAATWETCDGTVDETEIAQTCEDSIGAFTEDYIDRVGECLDDTCDAIAGCFAQAADDFDTAFVVPFAAIVAAAD